MFPAARDPNFQTEDILSNMPVGVCVKMSMILLVYYDAIRYW